MPSFIRQFRLHRTEKDSLVSCAVPHDGLDTTKGNKAQRVIDLVFTSETKPQFVYLGNNSLHMGKVGQGIEPTRPH